MELKRVKEIINMLANGRDPVSGDKIPDDSFLNHRDCVRALSLAAFYIPVEDSKQGQRGARWTAEEENMLTALFEAQEPIGRIASKMGRSRAAIKARLIKVGLLQYRKHEEHSNSDPDRFYY